MWVRSSVSVFLLNLVVAEAATSTSDNVSSKLMIQVSRCALVHDTVLQLPVVVVDKTGNVCVPWQKSLCDCQHEM